jgi:hypothetical protein
MKLFFCEEQSQVNAVADSVKKDRENMRIIALSPEAAWACQRQDISYLKLETFVQEKTLWTQRSNVLKQSYDWIHWLDDYLKQRIRRFGDAHFNAATARAAVFQQCFNEIYVTTYTLKALLKHFTNCTAYFWISNEPLDQDIAIHRASLVPYLLPDISKSFGIHLECQNNPSRNKTLTSRPSFKQHMLQFLRQRGWMGELQQARRLGIWRYLRSRRHQLTYLKNPLLILGYSYDMDEVVNKLREHGHPMKWIQSLDDDGCLQPQNDPSIRDALKKEWPTLLEQPSFWTPFESWGLNRNNFFASFIHNWWEDELPIQWELFNAAETILNKTRFGAVLSWETVNGLLTQPLMQAAQKQQIPCLIYQHGSTFRFDALWWYRLLQESDQFLVYGEGTASYLKESLPAWGSPPRATIHSVGSTRLDAIARDAKQSQSITLRRQLQGHDSRPIILYIPIHFGLMGRAFSDLAGYPDVSYFELQQRIFKIAAEFSHIRFMYKDFPQCSLPLNPMEEFIQSEVPNAQVIRHIPITKLCWAVDGIVIDHAITALAEALLTPKPLLVYDPGNLDSIPEPSEARRLLRKRARVAETPDSFAEQMYEWLKTGDFSELQKPNSECLARYGTFKQDGASAERVVQWIEQVMRP